jgi:hypothetical protein
MSNKRGGGYKADIVSSNVTHSLTFAIKKNGLIREEWSLLRRRN